MKGHFLASLQWWSMTNYPNPQADYRVNISFFGTTDGSTPKQLSSVAVAIGAFRSKLIKVEFDISSLAQQVYNVQFQLVNIKTGATSIVDMPPTVDVANQMRLMYTTQIRAVYGFNRTATKIVNHLNVGKSQFDMNYCLYIEPQYLPKQALFDLTKRPNDYTYTYEVNVLTIESGIIPNPNKDYVVQLSYSQYIPSENETIVEDDFVNYVENFEYSNYVNYGYDCPVFFNSGKTLDQIDLETADIMAYQYNFITGQLVSAGWGSISLHTLLRQMAIESYETGKMSSTRLVQLAQMQGSLIVGRVSFSVQIYAEVIPEDVDMHAYDVLVREEIYDRQRHIFQIAKRLLQNDSSSSLSLLPVAQAVEFSEDALKSYGQMRVAAMKYVNHNYPNATREQKTSLIQQVIEHRLETMSEEGFRQLFGDNRSYARRIIDSGFNLVGTAWNTWDLIASGVLDSLLYLGSAAKGLVVKRPQNMIEGQTQQYAIEGFTKQDALALSDDGKFGELAEYDPYAAWNNLAYDLTKVLVKGGMTYASAAAVVALMGGPTALAPGSVMLLSGITKSSFLTDILWVAGQNFFSEIEWASVGLPSRNSAYDLFRKLTGQLQGPAIGMNVNLDKDSAIEQALKAMELKIEAGYTKRNFFDKFTTREHGWQTGRQNFKTSMMTYEPHVAEALIASLDPATVEKISKLDAYTVDELVRSQSALTRFGWYLKSIGAEGSKAKELLDKFNNNPTAQKIMANKWKIGAGLFAAKLAHMYITSKSDAQERIEKISELWADPKYAETIMQELQETRQLSEAYNNPQTSDQHQFKEQIDGTVDKIVNKGVFYPLGGEYQTARAFRKRKREQEEEERERQILLVVQEQQRKRHIKALSTSRYYHVDTGTFSGQRFMGEHYSQQSRHYDSISNQLLRSYNRPFKRQRYG